MDQKQIDRFPDLMDQNTIDSDRRQFNRVFDDIKSQHSDLIELNGGWGRENDRKAISASQLTTLLILELNDIPQLLGKDRLNAQEVIETFKEEIESAELDELIAEETQSAPQVANPMGRDGSTHHSLSDGRGWWGQGEIPKFDDVNTLKQALACILIFCNHRAAVAWATDLSVVRLRDDMKDADDVRQHFLERLLEAQMNVIDNLTYSQSGYVFYKDQIYYAQQILNRIFETTGRIKQICSSLDTFEEHLGRDIYSYDDMPHLDYNPEDKTWSFKAEQWKPMPQCEECGAVEGGNIDGCDDCDITYWFNGKVYHPDSMIHIGAETNGATCASCSKVISEDDIIGDGTNRGLCCVPDYYGAESKTLDYTGNFSGSHDGVDYDVSYECSHDIDSSYEAEIRDYVEAKISNGDDSGYESFEMSTGFYEGEIEIEGTVTWESSETFDAPTGYTERGPRPFYGNPRKIAVDRWGNRRFIRRRKDGTYMKNVDVGRSLAMDRRRQSQTWAPAGFRDQGDGSPSLLVRLLDMFRGVDEEVLMAESYLMCADCDNYSSECGCHNSESDAYIYAYNDGHTDARRDGSYRPSTTDREITSFKKIFKQ